MSSLRLAATVCLAALAFPAAAQTAAPPEYPNQIGPAVRSRPAYDGSKSQRADVVPILDYDNSLLFARSVQGVLEGGAHAALGSGFTLGAQLAYEEGRKASESRFLRRARGMGGAARPGAGSAAGTRAPAGAQRPRRAGGSARDRRGVQERPLPGRDLRPGDLGQSQIDAYVLRAARLRCIRRPALRQHRPARLLRHRPALGGDRQHRGPAPAGRRGAQPARREEIELLRRRWRGLPLLSHREG